MEQLDSSSNAVDASGVSEPIRPTSARKRGNSKLTEWQSFFLDRLDYLLAVQQQGSADEAQATLLSKAVYSTYLDCQSQGVGEKATERLTAAGHTTPSDN